jgi:hypothetical protein
MTTTTLVQKRGETQRVNVVGARNKLFSMEQKCKLCCSNLQRESDMCRQALGISSTLKNKKQLYVNMGQQLLSFLVIIQQIK